MLKKVLRIGGMSPVNVTEHLDMAHCRWSENQLPSGKKAGNESSVSMINIELAIAAKSAQSHASRGIQHVDASELVNPLAAMQCSQILLRTEQNGRALQCGESEIHRSNNRIPDFLVCKTHIADQACGLAYPATDKAYSQNAKCSKSYYYVSKNRTRYRVPVFTNLDVVFPGVMWGGVA